MTGRVEEILEMDELVNELTEKVAEILERSGANRLHSPRALRELTRCEMETAMDVIGCTAFGAPPRE